MLSNYCYVSAKEIVCSIGAGVKSALRASELFLGIERIDYEFPEIRPEYLATVKIAENLTGPSVFVTIEAHLKHLRRHAIGLSRLRNLTNRDTLKSVEERLKSYKFGKKDSERLDILVQMSDDLHPPVLFVEVKLSIKSFNGLKKDVDRVLRLLEMYMDSGLLNGDCIYGAVVFHATQQGAGIDELNTKAKRYLDRIDQYCKSKATQFSWLHYKTGLLSFSQVEDPIRVEEIIHDEKTIEKVFARDKFAFAPGLVLMGNAPDIEGVNFADPDPCRNHEKIMAEKND